MCPLAALRALPLVLFALAVASRSAAQTPAAPADAIYTDAAVWTGKGAPLAEALAVRDGKVLAVGTRADVLRHRGPNTRVEPLGGAFVAPGFVDAHVHFLNGGFQLASVDLRAARTPAEFVARVAAFVRTGGPGGTPLPEGQWITGGDWDHEAWGGELPRRGWIDSVTARNPVFVNRLDGHMALANTRALGAGVFEKGDATRLQREVRLRELEAVDLGVTD